MISTKLFKSLFIMSLVVLSFQASAATITVNSTDDTIANDRQCTLREAIENANNGSDSTDGDCIAGDGDDVIYFAINGVINLKSELIVDSNIDFEGPGADKLTISGQESTRVFSIGKERHVVVSFYGVTIAEGSAGNNSNGGGIYNVNSDITILNSVLLGNSARYGGAIFNEEGTVKVINSSILGIDNLKNPIEVGGGIYNGNLTDPGSDTTIEITNSTLSNNKVTDSGGAIYNIGKLTISNSTLSGNQADNKGGGIYNSTWSGNLTIKNSTLSANKGGGIFIDDEDTGSVFIANTIIANNDGGDCHDNNSLTIKNTLIEDGSCKSTLSGDPQLGPLTNNGGPTLTHALLAGSKAIDAGDNTICTAEPINGRDQRGFSRFSDFTGSQCDIGAYEYQLPVTITVNSTADTIANDGWCTLREAIENANHDIDTTNGDCMAGNGDDVIIPAPNFDGIIEITNGELEIASNIKFQNLHLKNANFLTDTDNEPNEVAFENVTFEGGRINHFVTNVDLLIKKCFFQGFGGISGGGAITVEDSTFYKSTDRAITFSIGGYYDWFAKQLIIKNSTFEENQGGAISIGSMSADGIVEIANSTFLKNLSDKGSAIYLDTGNSEFNPILISNSTFHDNSATIGGTIFNQGIPNFKLHESSNSYLHVINSTFSQNSGGGIFNEKYYYVIPEEKIVNNLDCQICIDDYDSHTEFCKKTCWNERSKGVVKIIEGILTLKNTIIANSTNGKDCSNKGTIAANLNNLMGDGSCEPKFSGDPKLGPLTNNGGPTLTHALLSGSKAIDAGDNTTCTAEPVNGRDQRGFSRFSDFTGSQCDIGAYEYQLPATITVNSTADTIADDGWCTLREAIENANNNNATHVDCVAGRGDDVIYFAINGVIKLKSELESELIVNSNIDFQGPGADKLTISGEGINRVFVINSNAIVSINKMTIANGFANYYWTMGGGGIENYGILSITDSILFGNTANLGGGIDNEGELTITNSKLLSNIAEDNNGFHPCGGGGIFNAGTLNITNSTLQGNTTECADVTHANNGGAGIFNLGPFGANVTLTKSRLLDNIAQNTDDGGGILNMAGGTITIDQSELSSNLASIGGGIYNAGGDVITVNSTLSGNSASWGGGIYNSYNLTVINSTLSNNQATTIGGIFNEGGGPTGVDIANSIIANSEGGDCYNSSNKFTIRSTLIEDGSCKPTWSGDPKLDPLANNGGPTLTHALLSGSIAIDKGDDAICIAKPVNNRDQRGIPRVSDRLTGSHCDIGAYEYQNRVIRR